MYFVYDKHSYKWFQNPIQAFRRRCRYHLEVRPADGRTALMRMLPMALTTPGTLPANLI